MLRFILPLAISSMTLVAPAFSETDAERLDRQIKESRQREVIKQDTVAPTSSLKTIRQQSVDSEKMNQQWDQMQKNSLPKK